MQESREQTEMLLLLHNIDDRLKEILEIMKLSNSETLKTVKEKALSGSPLRQKIYELADGDKTVSDIAKELNKSLQQISNNIAILQKAGLIKEVRNGKEKYYLRTG